MTTAASYAKALYELVQAHPSQATTYSKNLSASLQRRGAQKLAPAIATEYQKLVVLSERSKRYKHPSAEKERTRVLLELYKKLTDTN